ncbi:hypothetical protein ACLB2K_015621 [Fragaria x ananassa]
MFSFLSKTVTMVKEAVTSNEYLVTTGAGAQDDMKIQKKTSVFRGLYISYMLIRLSPVNYNFQVHVLSIENHPFTITTNFTIGPRADDVDALRKYAVLLASLDSQSLQTVRNNIELFLYGYGIKVYNVDDLGDFEGHEEQGEEVPALNEDVQPYDEIEIDYYDV